MKLIRFPMALSLICIVFFSCAAPLKMNAQTSDFPFKNPNLPVDRRVDDLVSRMTLEEKISQIRAEPTRKRPK